MISITESLVNEVLLRYGDRALYVLRAAWEVAEEYRVSGKKYPGDFDFKGVIRKLREWGLRYNPNQLLRILEREYGLIETSYKTVTQHWYVFTDRESVEKALRSYGGLDEVANEIADPEEYVLEIQISMLNIDSLISRVKKIYRKPRLTVADKEIIKEIVLKELPNVAKVMKEALKYGDKYSEFVNKASTLLKIVREVVNRGSSSSTSNNLLAGSVLDKDVEIEGVIKK